MTLEERIRMDRRAEAEAAVVLRAMMSGRHVRLHHWGDDEEGRWLLEVLSHPVRGELADAEGQEISG